MAKVGLMRKLGCVRTDTVTNLKSRQSVRELPSRRISTALVPHEWGGGAI